MTGDHDVAGATALHHALLDANWRQVRLLELLSAGAAKRLMADDLEAEVAHANERLDPLEPWEGLSRASYDTYTGGANHVRIARLLDVVEPGERILDIGFGFGYVTAVLMRSGLVQRYVGIDLENRFVAAASEALRVNDLPDDAVRLEVGDVYELTPEWVAQESPGLVLMLEVLEHVPDPGLAFKVLGDALAPATSVLFTVPMLGRLEGVLGHRSLFDRARLQALCAGGGLTIHYVEPLHNTWTLVLASKDVRPPSRLGRMLAGRPPLAKPELDHGYTFRDVELAGSSLEFRRSGRPRRGRSRLRASRAGVQCEVTPMPDASPPFYGGLAFPADAPAILRLHVEYEQPEGIRAVQVDGYDGEERVAAWKWTLGSARPAPGQRMVHLLKPEGGGRFRPLGANDVGRVDRVELHVELLEDAESARFRLRRASYVSARDVAQTTSSAS